MGISTNKPLLTERNFLLTKKEIRDYYKNFKPYLREGMKNRLLKIQLIDGTWKRFYNIQKEEQLRSILVRYAPINAYCSISQWLISRNIEHPNYLANQIIIDSELWIEVDSSSGINPVEEIERIHDYIGNRLEFDRAVISGKGAYLYYRFPKVSIINPIERFWYFKIFRYQIIKEIYEMGFKIDATINERGQLISPCLDNFRVTRLENSIRQKNGLVCQTFNLGDTPRMQDGLEPVYIGSSSFTNRDWSLDGGEEPHPLTAYSSNSTIYSTTHKVVQNEKVLEHLSYPSRSYHFITNKANKNNYMLHLLFSKDRLNINKLNKLIKTYKLPDIYIFDNGGYYDCLSLKIMDRERLRKILNYTKANNSRVFERYGYSWIKINSLYLGKIDGLNDCEVSKSHNWYLNSRGIKTDYKRLVGWKKPKLNEARHNGEKRNERIF